MPPGGNAAAYMHRAQTAAHMQAHLPSNHPMQQVYAADNQQQQRQEDEIIGLIEDVRVPERRETALLELSKRREGLEDLAPILWHSFGVVVALIQEIVSVYPQLDPPNLAAPASNRVCNSLALLQCLASHNETRPLFLKAHIPLLLYPFLDTRSTDRPFEYLRLTALGVIGALVKVDDPEVVAFLLQTDHILYICLRIMENGSELSKTVATFVLQKLLTDEQGLGYVCGTADRFYQVAMVLRKMVEKMLEQPSIRLLKHVVRCYLRLSDHTRAREALRKTMPECLAKADPTLVNLPEPLALCLANDATTKKWLSQLLQAMQAR